MLSYVKLENFKSFGKINFDFKVNKNTAKKFIAIYGENGSGKSNFISVFDFLSGTLHSLRMQEKINMLSTHEFLEEAKNNNLSVENMREVLNDFSSNWLIDFEKIRRIGCDEPTVIEIGFILYGIEGYYKLAIKGDSFIKEELYYIAKDNRSILYSINKENGKIFNNFNNSLFSKKYQKEIEKDIQKFWGKNTLFSIILKDFEQKNEDFLEDNINENLMVVIKLFVKTTVICMHSSHKTVGKISGNENLLRDLERGSIKSSDIRKLRNCEKILKIFFTESYADIKDVYYNIDEKDNQIKYELIIRKMIAGKLTDVNFSRESAGTQKILDNMIAILGALDGKIVLIDEFDNGVHDILIRNILLSLKDEIEGQFIITTHNTLLLEEIQAKDAYVIEVDYEGNKQANCLADYDFKIQKNHNLRELFSKNMFGGVPYIEEIDFNEIKEELKNLEENDEDK